MLRPTKSQAIALVTQNASKYVEVFREFQAFDGGWLRWPGKFIQIRKNLGIDDYVVLYNNENHINSACMLFMHGEDGLKDWNQSLVDMSPEDQEMAVDTYTQELIDSDFEDLEASFPDFPETPEEEEVAKTAFEALSEEEQKTARKQAAFFCLFLFSSIHNYFSVMVNGEKLTSLVQKAMTGDEVAFLKAIQVDRHLLNAHPYFVDRYARARESGEVAFLRDVSYRLTNPNLRGKISYPGLYVVFAMLETLKWLDDLTHSEILDICDAAGLDRWQNRIEDVNYITKRLAGYRRYQKTGGVSMH